jgi:hypothetical protein
MYLREVRIADCQLTETGEPEIPLFSGETILAARIEEDYVSLLVVKLIYPDERYEGAGRRPR